MMMIFDTQEPHRAKEANINKRIYDKLTLTYNARSNPEDIFYYLYSILYSNSYRSQYAEFLKTDFPRIPFTSNARLFKKIGELGKRLVDLHLLQGTEKINADVRFQGKGSNRVENIGYDVSQNRVYVNPSQYFEGIEPEIWNYHIGGYQVCEKWLKDRKGRTLSLDEIKHYCKIITAIQRTIEVQNEIDEIYPEVEMQLIEF